MMLLIPQKKRLFPPFWMQGSGGSESLSDLLEVTQLESAELGLEPGCLATKIMF